MKRITIVGLGLIGGSVAKELDQAKVALELIGVEANPAHAQEALALGLVHKVLPLQEAVRQSDVVLLAIPVNVINKLLPELLDHLAAGAVVIDLGSTKRQLCASVKDHPKRGQYVAAHPIAGTENTGPKAAFLGLFRGKINIICEQEASSAEALATAAEIFNILGMNTTYMTPEQHDRQLAYTSHLSHVSAFMLSTTVMKKGEEEEDLFALAGSGFASAVRLAKSSPAMWAPIAEQNVEYLNQALSEYIAQLQRFQQRLQNKDIPGLFELMKEANSISPLLDKISKSHPIK
ncbi:prephenate dehydrogenase [Cesiribacter sp. SM1]|uniref:prephenate dehydrogenase n=1 Tax=Cesiribacter sp. SM1 TaxID=2861196 RepID=UPI001CD6DA9D|nr:prephenate dehydrogenase [Cesiribacter sp. SM1]